MLTTPCSADFNEIRWCKMQIDAAIIGVVVTVLLALLGLAYGYGSLTNKVKGDRYDIEEIKKSFRDYQVDNKADHALITTKLDTIIRQDRVR